MRRVATKLTTHNALRYAIASLVVVEGIDKFTRLLVDWHIYTAPEILSIWPYSHEAYLALLGVAEIFIGVTFFVSRRLGALLVAVMMAGIIFNLALLGRYINMIPLNALVALAALHIGLRNSTVSKET